MQKKINCHICGKEGLTRNEIGLNKKLIGKKIKQFFCLECMATYFDITVEDLLERIEEFKDEGCIMFG
jgi:uncharacterized protein YlaI